MSSNKAIVNKPAFRVLMPLFVGVVAYLLILLGFDSISSLKENFFGVEVVICVILSIGLMEILRVGLRNIFQRIEAKGYIVAYVVGIEVVVASALSLLFVSSLVSVYYHYLVGFSSFRTELVVFNAIYLFVSVAYSVFFVSTIYLTKTNLLAISIEKEKQVSMEKELSTYKSLINPLFLYAQLERIVVLLHGNRTDAAAATQSLSQVYRHVLTAKTSSLVSVSNEIEQLAVLAQLLNGEQEAQLVLQLPSVDTIAPNLCLVPTTLHSVALFLVSQFITSSSQPLTLKMFEQDGFLIAQATGVRRLIPLDFSKDDFEVINRAYSYFANRPIVVEDSGNTMRVLIKLITVEE